MKHSFESKQDWYDALMKIAMTHYNMLAVRDFEGWTENWRSETPKEAYYKEFPEHENMAL